MNIFAMVRLLLNKKEASQSQDLTLMTCPTCGNKQEESLSDKRFLCQSCGITEVSGGMIHKVLEPTGPANPH